MKARRLTVLLLALCLLAILLPQTAFAAETASGTCGENLTWVLTEDGTLTISGEGPMDDFAHQGEPWYRYRDSIITVVLEEGVTNLGDYAFCSATNLFDIILPESLERIGNAALMSSRLMTIYIPSGVTEIGTEAFEGNYALSWFNVSTDNPAFSSDNNGVLFNKDKTYLIRCPQAFEGAYVIPDTVEFVGEKAFNHCSSLTEVTVSGSVKELRRHAFFDCTALKTVHLREGLEIIGNSVFSLCSALEGRLTIPSTVTQIGSSPFDFNALTEMWFPADMPEISEYAFACAALTVYYPGDNETWTAEKIEAIKGLSTFVPYDPTEEIASGTWGDNITWVLTYDGTLTVSGEGEAAEESSGNPYPWREYAELIRRVVFEQGVINVPAYAFEFSYPNLAAVELKSVEILDYAAFRYCSALTSVALPDTLKEIRNGAFSSTALTEIDIPAGVTLIGSNAFYRTNLTEIVLPEGLLTLYDGVFWECKQLKYAYLPDSITKIGMHLFYGCTALETANIPKNLPYVPDAMFAGCSSLKSIEIPDGVTTIAMTNFRGTALTSVTIPASVTYMGSAFMECADLKEIIFEGDAPDIGDICFEGVTATAYYPAGNDTWTAEVRQNYGGNLTWEVKDDIELPPMLVLFDLYGANMTLGNELAMNFFVQASDLEGTGYYAKVVRTYSDGREDVTLTIPYDQWANNGSYKMFTVTGIAAKEMTEEIYITIYKTDGTQVSHVWEDSVAAYVKRNIAKWTGETRTMGIDMLNYGAAAQEYFEYNLDDLANAGMEDYQQYATADVACVDSRVKGANYYGSNLTLESSITLTMYFSKITPDMNAVVTFTDHYGRAQTVNIPGSEFQKNGSFYGIIIDELVLADCRQLVTCTVYDAEGNEVASAVDSVESYIARMSTNYPVFQKIMNFADGAWNYFH